MTNVQLHGLTKSYVPGKRVIDELDLNVEQGEFVTLLGPSGCGKTTTLRCIAGLESPDSGEIRIGDQVVNSTDGAFVPPERRRLGLVFQNYALWPHMSVEANVAYPLKMRRVPAAERRTEVSAALTAVGLAEQAKRPATMLSGGQQQRVSLARAMVGTPRMLLFDEPLSNLDAQLRGEMRTEIRRAHDSAGVASIFVTHDQEEATVLSDRVIVLRGGKIEQQGGPREIFRNPRNRFVAAFFGYDNFLEGTVTSVRGEAITVRLNDGAEIHCTSTRRPEVGSRVELTIRSRDIRIGPNPFDGRSNSFHVPLTQFLYSGDELSYTTELSGSTLHVIRADDDIEHPLTFEPGPLNEMCHIHLPPNRLVLLDNDSADE